MIDILLFLYLFIYLAGYFSIFLFKEFKQIHLLTLNEQSTDVINKTIEEKAQAFTPALYVFFPMFVQGIKTILADIYQQKDSKVVIGDIEKFSENLFATKSEAEHQAIKKNFIKQLLKLE